MSTYLLGRTSRVRVGAAVVNQSLTHPLRFAERAALLDRIGDGRADLCIGRGYQWPQNVVFEVEEATTKARFTESLDIILDAWTEHRQGSATATTASSSRSRPCARGPRRCVAPRTCCS